MSCGLLLVTHGRLGQHLLATVRDVIGELPLDTDILEVRRVQDTEVLIRQGTRMIERLDSGDGVLILTDAYGSTPGNLATRVATDQRTRVVAGVNMPMLLRVFNYHDQALDALSTAAIEGGRRGIVDCQHPD
ncbi:PTS fructose transporter subunit IIA [Abyssibacter sp.]|jgi:PTS system ascorbate-specific IIA component|uniref:PTS sugar transporter subunit IIA n=1 Tax=Abyssibacter sp. TaxID=2320200 RepID=UPI000C3734E6|nr:PTS fructose transporter subunit IIA [Abyssibacter sp.]MBB86632.1 PTS fructose transporter subunit IIA [Xanthomonadales bacterium]MCK5860004.1 PTS fructose transporter subunit IIA [Abyssibacter sp.]